MPVEVLLLVHTIIRFFCRAFSIEKHPHRSLEKSPPGPSSFRHKDTFGELFVMSTADPFAEFVNWLSPSKQKGPSGEVEEEAANEDVHTTSPPMNGEKTCDIGGIWNAILCVPPMMGPPAEPYSRPKKGEVQPKPPQVKKKTLDEEYEDWLASKAKSSKDEMDRFKITSAPPPPTLAPVSMPPSALDAALAKVRDPVRPLDEEREKEATRRRQQEEAAAKAKAHKEADGEQSDSRSEEARLRDEQMQRVRESSKESREREEAALAKMIADKEMADLEEKKRIALKEQENATLQLKAEAEQRQRELAAVAERAEREAGQLKRQTEELAAKEARAALIRKREEEREAAIRFEEQAVAKRQALAEAARRKDEEAKAKARQEADSAASAAAAAAASAAEQEVARARADTEAREKAAAQAVALAAEQAEKDAAAAASFGIEAARQQSLREEEARQRLNAARAQEEAQADAKAAEARARAEADAKEAEARAAREAASLREREAALEKARAEAAVREARMQKERDDAAAAAAAATAAAATAAAATAAAPKKSTWGAFGFGASSSAAPASTSDGGLAPLIAALTSEGLVANIFLPNREGQYKMKDIVLKGKRTTGMLSCEFWTKDKKKKLRFAASDVLKIGKGTCTQIPLPPGTNEGNILHLALKGKPELNLSFESQQRRDELVVSLSQLVEAWKGISPE